MLRFNQLSAVMGFAVFLGGAAEAAAQDADGHMPAQDLERNSPVPDGEVRAQVERLGVFEIPIIGFGNEFYQTVVDVVATAITETGRFDVISSSDLKALLGHEANKQLLGCDEVSCFAEIALAAGVELLAAGSVSLVGDAIVISLQLIDSQTVEVRRRLSIEWRGPRSGLGEALTVAAELLVIPSEALAPGSLRLGGLEPGASILVDGKPHGDGRAAIEGLAPGIHELSITAPGFEPYKSSVVIRNGLAAQVTPQLRRTKRLWERWWFWTAVGVAVAGGTVAALALAGQTEPLAKVDFRMAAPGVEP